LHNTISTYKIWYENGAKASIYQESVNKILVSKIWCIYSFALLLS